MRIDGFDWDNGNWPKCASHGLTKMEIEHALRNEPFVLPDRTETSSETRFNAIGQNQQRRYVFIVYTIRSRTGMTLLRPISARYMHKKEIGHHEFTKGIEKVPTLRKR